MADKQLDKIAALLRQAESSKNKQEADAYFDKAQQLARVNAISLEMARQHQADKEKRETPITRTIQIGSSGKRGLKYYCRLFMAIGKANDLRFNIAHNSTYLIAFGFPSDIEVTELLYSSLIHHMVSSSDEFLRSGEHKKELDWSSGKPVDGRVARSSFMESYISRIGSRFSEANAAALVEAKLAQESTPDFSEENNNTSADSTGMEMVLVKKEIEVSDFYRLKSTAKRSWGGYSCSSGFSASGSNAGREAANRANLSGRRALSN